MISWALSVVLLVVSFEVSFGLCLIFTLLILRGTNLLDRCCDFNQGTFHFVHLLLQLILLVLNLMSVFTLIILDMIRLLIYFLH